jgi:hypothetical protein
MENFALPESFDGLSNEELSALIDQARSEFNGLNESDDVSDETLERMESLANAIEDIQTEKIRRVEAAARREELAARVAEEVEEPVVEEAEVEAAVEVAETEAEVTEAATKDDTAVELAKSKKKVTKAEDDAEDAADNGADEDTETMSAKVAEEVVTESTLETEKESVVAASPNTSIPEKTNPQVLIAAAQDVPQFYVGQRLDPSLLADALHNKARMLSDSRGNQTVYPVATIERPFGQGYDLEGLDQASTWDALAEMTKPTALVASGGWCAPSETVYNLFEVECENDVLYTLPTFRVTRGGIRWPVFVPHNATLNPGFTWTEANDIAATGGTPTKPCVTIPCPTFTECRLDAVGLCITAGNLIDRAYPEQVRWFINRAIRAYERNNSIRKLNAVIADTVPVSIAATFGAASALISAILLQAASYRQFNGLCASETLDVVAPYWVSDVVKADVARQQGALVQNGGVLTDADVSAFFAAANLNLRYIAYWQDFAVQPTLVWPASVQILVGYPGAYVEFNQGRLDLGVIRDSVLNKTNDYTAVWFEEFYCVGRRGPQARLITLPIAPLGEVGGRNPSTGEVVVPAA